MSTFEEILDGKRLREVVVRVVGRFGLGPNEFLLWFVGLLEVDLQVDLGSVEVFDGEVDLHLLRFLLREQRVLSCIVVHHKLSKIYRFDHSSPLYKLASC
jgi:hypothetical protein